MPAVAKEHPDAAAGGKCTLIQWIIIIRIANEKLHFVHQQFFIGKHAFYLQRFPASQTFPTYLAHWH